ncbi:Vid27 family protein [Thecamonas trahens ATCC 50062]|uniref:Vid27 family protein n=1 Tax=Thecamonas trahens ATCC 50062 TaxID=461836 RepID=A0A0L0DJ86_THETB|nr:Vid27 family protein [Thecamonas trahens ATCC 50062]KNC52126.1 Vid27 family protein [Thecamonas trahens ATCC 50062]|eukprot:XP_013762130.1 Vid27 family protein [Thecamonas trahens ATCC 50062]
MVVLLGNFLHARFELDTTAGVFSVHRVVDDDEIVADDDDSGIGELEFPCEPAFAPTRFDPVDGEPPAVCWSVPTGAPSSPYFHPPFYFVPAVSTDVDRLVAGVSSACAAAPSPQPASPVPPLTPASPSTAAATATATPTPTIDAPGELVSTFSGLTLYVMEHGSAGGGDDDDAYFSVRFPAASVGIYATGKFEASLGVADGDSVDAGLAYVFPICPAMHFGYDAEADAVMFASHFDGRTYTWSLRVTEGCSGSTDALRAALTRHLWEAQSLRKWSSLKDADKAWILRMMTGEGEGAPSAASRTESALFDLDDDDLADMDLAADDEWDADGVGYGIRSSAAARRATGVFDVESDAGGFYASPRKTAAAPGDDAEGDVNALLELGMASSRAFVGRGSSVGVFGLTADDDLEFSAAIDGLAYLDGTPLVAAQMMLHDRDDSMLMVSPVRPDRVARVDLHRGAVVDEFTSSPDPELATRVRRLAPNTKFDSDATFVGLNKLGLFRMDPRLPSGSQLVPDHGYTFKPTSKPLLSCIAATADGGYAVGSDRGEVRLFAPGAGIGKRPKTTFPSVGAPITALDVTADGAFVLATTATFLALLPTLHPEVRGATGFTKPLGKSKPAPIQLYLLPQHVALFGGSISFTPARFDVSTASGSHERVIVASTGPWVITWSLARVARRDVESYTFMRADDVVTASSWLPSSTSSFIVTERNDVKVAHKQ